MSTKLTTKAGGKPQMVDSQSLQLAFALGNARDALFTHVAEALDAAGYKDATPTTLWFLGQLECGVNHASEIARQLDISRQMVSKTVKGLVKSGFLEMQADPERGNQKIIIFTALGEQLMADTRRILADLDETFAKSLGASDVQKLMQGLGTLTKTLAGE